MAQTIAEIRKKYGEDEKALRESYTEAINERLKEIHLDGLVRRKSDSRVGWLEVDFYGALCFYPRTKAGERSIIQNGSVGNVEDNFEPYIEG